MPNSRFFSLFFLLLVHWTILFPDPAQAQRVTDPGEFLIHYIDSLNREAMLLGNDNHPLLKKYADMALSLANRIRYEKGIAQATFSLAQYESSRENYLQALDLFYMYLAYIESNGTLSEKAFAFVKISLLYQEIKNYELALTYCRKADTCALRSGIPYDISLTNLCYAHYYYHIHKVVWAIDHADTAQKYAQLSGDLQQEARAEKLLGDLYIEEKSYETSVAYYKRAIQDFRKLGNQTEVAIILTRLAHIDQLQGKFQEAYKNSKEALNIRLLNSNQELISLSLVNLGTALLNLKKPDSAFAYYQRGLAIANKVGNLTVIEYALKQLFQYYKKQGDFSNALLYLERYLKVHDSLLMERNNSELNAFELRYQKNENESQLRILQKENEIQRLNLENQRYSGLISQLLIGIVGAIVIITVYIVERNKARKTRLETINRQLNQEIEERKQTEIQLRTSEELYRFVTDHTLDLIVRMDRKLTYLFVSPSVRRMFGFPPDEPFSLPPVQQLIPVDFHGELWRQYMEMIRTKKPVMLTHQSIKMDGSCFWSESLVNPIFDTETGKLVETITVIRDITDRITYEEALAETYRQKEVLLREIHHRVKNNFAILVSLMDMQKLSANPGEFIRCIDDLQGRVRSMALVHDLLYRSQDIDFIDFRDYLNKLISIIARAFKNKPVEILSDLEPCILDVETALPLGLISNELLTNAYKYAFEDHPGGRLWIDLHPFPALQEQNGGFTHTLSIRDNGPGLPDNFSPETNSSMGSQIITLLVNQLEGRLDVNGREGASFTIYFSDANRS